MKRGGPLRRGAPMKRGAPLKRTAMRRTASTKLGGHTPTSPDLVVARAFVRERSGGACEAGTILCSGVAQAAHHVLPRSAGGGHSVANLLDVCNACHRYIHAHPTESYETGWLRKRGSI